MRLGIWGARADRRGLAVQSQTFADNLAPAKVMGFDLTAEDRSPYPCDWSPFDGHDLTVERPLTMDAATVREWVDGLDVVLMFETPYRWDIFDACKDARVATVVHANPEFAPWLGDDSLPWPTRTVLPTPWLASRFNGRALVLPTPVDLDRWPRRELSGEPTFLHVAGHPAALDRAGTRILLRAAHRMSKPATILFRSQQPLNFGRFRLPAHVRMVVDETNVADPRDLYAVGDVFVTPRRYGGQHLPMQEAAATGLAVVTSGVPPQDGWFGPSSLVGARRQRKMRTQGGPVHVWETDPNRLADRLDLLASDPGLVAEMADEARAWAVARSWDVLRDDWVALLKEAAADA